MHSEPNIDGNTLTDLMPNFPIPNLVGYVMPDDLLSVLDAFSAEHVDALESMLDALETLFPMLHATGYGHIFRIAISTLIDNTVDLAADWTESNRGY